MEPQPKPANLRTQNRPIYPQWPYTEETNRKLKSNIFRSIVKYLSFFFVLLGVLHTL